MARLIVCRNCTESDCTYCNMNILAVALERGYFNSLMREQHTVQIDSELVPVRHGHWDNKIIDGRFDVPHTVARCSNCKGKIWVYEENYVVKYPYCPLCGCKMDEVTE